MKDKDTTDKVTSDDDYIDEVIDDIVVGGIQ